MRKSAVAVVVLLAVAAIGLSFGRGVKRAAPGDLAKDSKPTATNAAPQTAPAPATRTDSPRPTAAAAGASLAEPADEDDDWLLIRVRLEDDVGAGEIAEFELKGSVTSGPKFEPCEFKLFTEDLPATLKVPQGADPRAALDIDGRLTIEIRNQKYKAWYSWDGLFAQNSPDGWVATLPLRLGAQDPDDGRWLVGRCLAVDGVPLAAQSITILPPYLESWMDPVPATTGPDGRFAAYMETWDEGLADTINMEAPWRWASTILKDVRQSTLSPEWQLCDRPALDAGTVDVGDLTWRGGLLAVSVKDLPPETQIRLQLESGDIERSLTGAAPLRLPCVPGHYEGTARWDNAEMFPDFCVIPFACAPLPGVVTPVELVLPPPQTLEIDVRGEDGPLSSAWLQVTWGTEERTFWDTLDSDALPATATLHGVETCRVIARADGYEPGVEEASLASGRIIITLERSEPDESVERPQTERHLLYFSYEASTALEISEWSVWLRSADGMRDHFKPARNGVLAFEVSPGRYLASMYGGLEFGYRGGLFAGPVEIDVVEGTQRYTFSIGAPNQEPCLGSIEFRCCSREVYGGPVPALGPEGQPLALRPGRMSRSDDKPGLAPVALADGVGGEIKIAPAKWRYGGSSSKCLVVEVPERVRVKLLGATDDESFSVELSGASGLLETYSDNAGVAHLWYAQGPASLCVRDGDVLLAEREIAVPAAGVLEIELPVNGARVEFTVRWADTVPGAERGMLADWTLFGLTGSTYTELDEVENEDVRRLPVGKYLLTPMNHAIGGRVEFTCDGQTSRKLVLEQTRLYARGAARVAVPGSGTSDCWFEFVPAEWQELLTDSDAFDAHSVEGLVQNAGSAIVLANLPAGRPCIVYAGCTNADGVEWRARAFVATATSGDGPLLRPEWTAVRELEDEWDDAGIEWRYVGTSCWQESWDLPQCEVEIRLRARPDLRIVRYTVPPGEEPLPLPDVIKQLLNDAG